MGVGGGILSKEGKGTCSLRVPGGPSPPLTQPGQGGSALRVGQRTMGKLMWTNQFPNYFPLLPSTRREKGRGQRGKGLLGPELQLPLRRESGPWPSSLHLQPVLRLKIESRLEACCDPPFPLASPWREKAMEGEEQRSSSPRIYSNSCQILLGLFKK